DTWRIGTLHDTAGVLGIDATSIVEAECHRHRSRNFIRKREFRLKTRSAFIARVGWIDAICESEAEVIPAQAAFNVQPSVQKVDALLSVAGSIGHVCISARSNIQGHPVLLRIESDIDLIVVKVCAGCQQRNIAPELVGMKILCVESFLIARIMLLNPVAMYRIVQEKREVRVQVEKRAAQESIGL